MFEFLKRNYSITSPADGKVVDLSQIPDQVFSNKLGGEGVAIIPSSNIFTAPASGVVSLIFDTNHAFTITLNNGINILVHIGLDTIDLNGAGFQRLVDIGTSVKAGTPIIKVDELLMKGGKYSFITPVVITNPDKAYNIEVLTNCNVRTSIDKIISYNLVT